jgi:hypothetical protein
MQPESFAYPLWMSIPRGGFRGHRIHFSAPAGKWQGRGLENVRCGSTWPFIMAFASRR